MRSRPVLHETETETETDYYETETETKNVVLRARWSRDLNILAVCWRLIGVHAREQTTFRISRVEQEKFNR